MQGSFSLPRLLVRILRRVIQPFVLPLFDTRQDLALGCAVAGTVVGDDHPQYVLAALEERAEELLGCRFVSPTLHQRIEHGNVLTDHSPIVVCVFMGELARLTGSEVAHGCIILAHLGNTPRQSILDSAGARVMAEMHT